MGSEASKLDQLTSQLTNLPELIARLGLGIAAAQKALNVDYVEGLSSVVGQALRIAQHDRGQPSSGGYAEIAKAATDLKAKADAAEQARVAAEGANPPDAQKTATYAAAKKAYDDALATFASAVDGEGKGRMDSIMALLRLMAPSRYQFTETTLDFSADLSQSMRVGVDASLGVSVQAVAVNAALTLGYGYDYHSAARITTRLHAIPADMGVLEKLLGRAAALDGQKLSPPTLNPVDAALFTAVGNVYNAQLDSKKTPLPAPDPANPTKTEKKA
jgi:hypothetical protein